MYLLLLVIDQAISEKMQYRILEKNNNTQCGCLLGEGGIR